MLSPRENLLETIRGNCPDRYVNQFEAFAMQWCTPIDVLFPLPECGGEPKPGIWGAMFAFPEGTPGAFPLHDEEHLVIKDITRWRDYVKMPQTDFPEEDWAWIVAEADKVDRSQHFCTAFVGPGVFENCHHMMGMEECMLNLYEEPECMHELIGYITEYELKLAENICSHIHPDAIYHHDDWGSQTSSFMSPRMFREFLLEPYKKIYGYYKSHGVELIIHHSDSYLENMIPELIEAGIDIWQGVMSTNNIPEIIKQYGGQLTLMGGIDNGKVDRPDWTEAAVRAEVDRICRWAGTKYFIPNTTYGGDESTYPGVYETVTDEISRINREICHRFL